LFDAGRRTEQFLDGGAKRVFRLMWLTYRAILKRIERDPLVVLRKRVRISKLRKCLMAARVLVER
jgi:phytoene/squalene synthetase